MDKEVLEKIKPGAKVKVWEKISAEGHSTPRVSASRSGSASGGKEGRRLSAFEGIVLARKHGSEAGATFTVRAVLQEVGVEKIYPIHSPTIAKVEIISSPRKVSRSKLYYLRNLSSKKVKEKLAV